MLCLCFTNNAVQAISHVKVCDDAINMVCVLIRLNSCFSTHIHAIDICSHIHLQIFRLHNHHPSFCWAVSAARYALRLCWSCCYRASVSFAESSLPLCTCTYYSVPPIPQLIQTPVPCASFYPFASARCSVSPSLPLFLMLIEVFHALSSSIRRLLEFAFFTLTWRSGSVVTLVIHGSVACQSNVISRYMEYLRMSWILQTTVYKQFMATVSWANVSHTFRPCFLGFQKFVSCWWSKHIQGVTFPLEQVPLQQYRAYVVDCLVLGITCLTYV